MKYMLVVVVGWCCMNYTLARERSLHHVLLGIRTNNLPGFLVASKKTGCCSLVTGWESGAVSSKKVESSLAMLGFDCVAARTCSMRDTAPALSLLASGLFMMICEVLLVRCGTVSTRV